MADHIQLPQTWMKNFRHKTQEGDKVFCLWCLNDELKEEKIKTLGAVENYYAKSYEEHLGKVWETPFGEILKKIRDNVNSESDRFELQDDEINFIKKFLCLSMGRSKTFKKIITKVSHISISSSCVNVLSPLSVEDEGATLFENYNIQFIYNNTDLGFILPSYTYYYFIDPKQTKYMIMVITDKIAIKFVLKDHIPELKHDNNCAVLKIYDIEEVKHFNKCAYLTEICTNNDFLVAKNKKDLEELLNLFKKER